MAEPLVTIETDVLIVGAGPAGAALGCFLGYNGVKGLIISTSSSTVKTPRAHYTNLGTMECLREIGIEDECIDAGILERDFGRWYRWGQTMTSGELTRRWSNSNNPYKHGEYFDASPCKYLDLPQTKSEPLLLKYATQHGFQIRFDTRMLSFVDDEKAGIVTTLLEDGLTGQKLQVKSRFLAGADGAKSKTAEQLGLDFTTKPGGGLSLSVVVEADLSHMMTGPKDSAGFLSGQYMCKQYPKGIFANLGLFMSRDNVFEEERLSPEKCALETVSPP